jgi:hypothetical protein
MSARGKFLQCIIKENSSVEAEKYLIYCCLRNLQLISLKFLTIILSILSIDWVILLVSWMAAATFNRTSKAFLMRIDI